HEHVERFRHARLNPRLAFDDGLVNLGAAIDVVRLRREQLLQDVRGAVSFERPDFHFAEALAAELRFAAQGLLGNQRVRADGAGVNLVVDKMRKFEHVDVADGNGLIELLAGHAVVEHDLAVTRQAGDLQQVADFRFARAVKHRRGEGNAISETFGVFDQVVVFKLRERFPDGGLAEDFPEPAAQGFGPDFLAEEALQAVGQLLGSPAKVRFENLADVHTRRNAKGVENNFHGGAVGKIGHIFLGHDAGDDALVAVAPGHFVADREFALHGDVNLDQLDHARRQFVALLELFLALFGDLAEDIDLA